MSCKAEIVNVKSLEFLIEISLLKELEHTVRELLKILMKNGVNLLETFGEC